MNTVTLYKNPNPYPYFGSITVYKTIKATPRHQDLRSGYVDLQLTQDQIFNFNYISFTKNGKTIYAWVENVEHRSGNMLWRVHFTTDAYRTYKNDIVYGTQYIARSPKPTLLEDEFLSSTRETNWYSTKEYRLSNHALRYCVVQVRKKSDSVVSNTPAIPSPYRFYFTPYNINNWTQSDAVAKLIYALGDSPKSSNIVTIYSIPYANCPNMVKTTLTVTTGDTSIDIPDWYFLHQDTDNEDLFTRIVPIDIPENLTKTRHNVSLVFPDSGIMHIPDELLYKEGLAIRQDIDIFSGACNYMLTYNNGETPTHLSVRGSALSTIPILSDPYDTYISQNQNTLAVTLLGDTATTVGGVLKRDPVQVMEGLQRQIQTHSTLNDAQLTIPSNPPAFLGSATVRHFNQRFYRVIMQKPYDNESVVRARYGYPYHKVDKLVPPTSGFIQTRNCSVRSSGNVPLWAINEINALFNNGINFI